MEHKKLLRRFRWQLFWQASVRSLLWGATAGAAALFICSLVWHLLIKTPPFIWLQGSFGAGFVLGFIPCMWLEFPTGRRTAARLDETGLQERTGTMLQFAKKEGLMVQLQRKDAAEHIRETSVRKLKLRISLKELLALGITALLCAGMLLIPYDLLAPPPEKPPEVTAWEQHVHAQIDALRQQIRDSQLSAEAQAELEAILAQLEQDLLNTDSELEQAALIQQAQEDMEDVLYNNISRRVIGRALQQYDLTTALGAQICTDMPWDISNQMENLKRDITTPTKQLTKLGNNINNALTISGVDPTDELYTAFADFGAGLIDMANYTIGPDGEQGWTMKDLDFLFEVAQERIVAALEQQTHDEAELAQMDGFINAGLQSLMEQAGENAPQQGGMKPQSSGQSGKQPQGGGDGSSTGTPVGGMFDDGLMDDERTTMLEGIYDPLSGDVTYGEVFAAYYAQYLQALDAGEIPEELRPYFERYFSSLS